MRRFLILCLAMAGAPAPAQQALYKELDEGWFIYKEAQSCVLYADFPGDTMLRLSHREDVDRIYFSVYNSNWGQVRSREGQTMMLYLSFPDLQRHYGAAAIIVENPDGRMGFSTDTFPVEQTLRGLSTEKGFILSRMFKDETRATEIGRFGTVGAALAVTHLSECNLYHFSK